MAFSSFLRASIMTDWAYYAHKVGYLYWYEEDKPSPQPSNTFA